MSVGWADWLHVLLLIDTLVHSFSLTRWKAGSVSCVGVDARRGGTTGVHGISVTHTRRATTSKDEERSCACYHYSLHV